jgi:hypothetical protein
MKLPDNVTEYLDEYTRRFVLHITFKSLDDPSSHYTSKLQKYKEYVRNGGSYQAATDDDYQADDDDDGNGGVRYSGSLYCHVPLHLVRENFNVTAYFQRSSFYHSLWYGEIAYRSSEYSSDFWIASAAAVGGLAGLFVWRRRQIRVKAGDDDAAPEGQQHEDPSSYMGFEMEIPAVGPAMQVV